MVYYPLANGGSIKNIYNDLDFFCVKYCNNKNKTLLKAMLNVSEACTGGSFESRKAAKDKENRYLLVINSINEIRSELFRYKI